MAELEEREQSIGIFVGMIKLAIMRYLSIPVSTFRANLLALSYLIPGSTYQFNRATISAKSFRYKINGNSNFQS
ncbi:hypothetical protein HC928_24595 [bacterium]|nr:hypothetical protein [bacterium]